MTRLLYSEGHLICA